MLLRICLGQKDINKDVSRNKLFWTLFSEEGILDSERGAIWCKLLKIDQIIERSQGIYKKLANLENDDLDIAIDKDGIERAGILKQIGTSDFVIPDETKIKRILRAYGNQDPEVGYH